MLKYYIIYKKNRQEKERINLRFEQQKNLLKKDEYPSTLRTVDAVIFGLIEPD